MRSSMMRNILLIGLVILCTPLLGRAETPTESVKTLLESVRSYKKETPTLSAQDRAANAQVQKTVEATLGIPDLAKEVLGPHWAKLSAPEQKNFIQLLESLLRKVAYPKSAEFFGDLRIDYVGERVNGKEAVVETSVSHPKEGQVSIEYNLRQKDSKWVITDILLDEVSLVTNLRTQMQQVIAKESYQELLRRMREKLAEES
jgi:phospholipid transport system substrate-binding protein